MRWREIPERGVRWFDDVQQTRWWLAHPIGTIRKYADDRSSALAGLVTFHLFLGLLPLLVVMLTVFARLAEGSDNIRDAILDSTLAQLPVLGSRLDDQLDALPGSNPWVVISVLGLLWTSTGIYNSLQLALNQVWNVRGVHRQGFVNRLVRSFALFVLVLVAGVGTVPLRGDRPWGFLPDQLVPWIGLASSVVVSIVVLALVFRIAVSSQVPARHLLPAAVLAGLLWQLIQRLGEWIVIRQLADAEDLYGSVGFVVVVLLWINLLARSALFANEWAVVSVRHLWPRRITQPPLTAADRDVLESLVRNEQRRPEQHIEVWFDPDACSPRPPRT